MNRRMQKAKDARKYYAARHRWAARLRAEIRSYPVATTDDRVDAFRFIGNVPNLVINDRVKCSPGVIYARTRPADMPEVPPSDRLAPLHEREEEFARIMAGIDPWPCMNCSYVTHHVTLQTGQVVARISHMQTCATCRAKGAPDTLPA